MGWQFQEETDDFNMTIFFFLKRQQAILKPTLF